MTHKNYMALVTAIFSIVAIMHILRLLNGWQIQIGPFMVPTWASIIGALLAGYLAYQGIRLKK